MQLFKEVKSMQMEGGTLLNSDEITIDLVKRIMSKLNVNKRILPPERMLVGILVELEHDGRMGKNTDVTYGDLLATAKIALAHFAENPGNGVEFPDYYYFLETYVERPAEIYWEGRDRVKPSIFIT